LFLVFSALKVISFLGKTKEKMRASSRKLQVERSADRSVNAQRNPVRQRQEQTKTTRQQ
jgi:hypothetical protein